jgi:hypothetical protein
MKTYENHPEVLGPMTPMIGELFQAGPFCDRNTVESDRICTSTMLAQAYSP